MIKTTIEKMTCCSCEKEMAVSIMTDVDDEDSPELVQLPAGAFLTTMLIGDDEDESWVAVCSTECATELVETYDEDEDGSEVEIEEKH